jgi:hypothetical protein
MTRPIPTNNYVNHYDKHKARHRAFFQAALDRLAELDPEWLQPGGEGRDIWIAAVETKAPSPTPNDSLPAQAAPATPVTWESMVEMAKVAGARYPELVAAQGALESGWYQRVSGTHNYFGLKGSGTVKSTQEFIDGKWITIKDGFINFGSPQEAVDYLVSRWYKDFKSYKGVNNAGSREAAARELVKQGYATDPQYADKLIRLMNERSPATSVSPPIQPQQSGPSLIVIPGADGPKKTPHDFGFKRGDSHVIVNDITESATAFDFDGKQLWRIPCLARGQGSDYEYRNRNTDTPPGIYRIGQVYGDYERVGANPAFDQTLMSYGWYSFDMVELENQEAKYGRSGIMAHGGGSACGWPGAWASRQPLFPTHGCVRCHNIDLRDKWLPLIRSGTVFISVFQEKLR